MNKIIDRNHLKRIGLIACFIIGVLLVLSISVMKGTINYDFITSLEAIFHQSDHALANQIIHNVRLPRVLIGLMVGINLGISGILLQGVLRNPLASQQVIGVNAGAGFCAVAVMILVPNKINWLPVGALLGAVCATLLVYLLTIGFHNKQTMVHIILAGVALSSLLNALTSSLIFLNSDDLQITYFWLLGSLSGRSWPYFHLIWPYTLGGSIVALIISPKLNLFHLGDEMGSSLGLNVKLFRAISLLTASVLAGSAVSVAGTIGFIGLIAPHIARLLIGYDYRYLTLLSGLTGGILLMVSDVIARLLFRPIELSVGIITAIIGALFFLFVLYNHKR